MSAVAADPTHQSGRSRKKKAKSEAPAQPTPPPAEAEVGNGSADAVTNGTDGSSGNPYIKEIQKYVFLATYARAPTNNRTRIETSAI